MDAPTLESYNVLTPPEVSAPTRLLTTASLRVGSRSLHHCWG